MSPAALIDTHAHLTDERLRDAAADLVQRATASGVAEVVTIGTDADDSRAAIALAERIPGVRATVGIHPHGVGSADDAAADQIRELADHSCVCGIGEIGLDYHYDFSPRPAQRSWFSRQLQIARESGLPAVVHCREAATDLGAALAAEGRGTRGVLHSFAGDQTLLEQALEIGWYVSFSGIITFKRFAGADLVRTVPLDRILVETDSPYLAPVPHRGKTNEPAYVRLVAEKAAAIRGEDPAEFAAATVRNARELFRRAPIA